MRQKQSRRVLVAGSGSSALRNAVLAVVALLLLTSFPRGVDGGRLAGNDFGHRPNDNKNGRHPHQRDMKKNSGSKDVGGTGGDWDGKCECNGKMADFTAVYIGSSSATLHAYGKKDTDNKLTLVVNPGTDKEATGTDVKLTTGDTVKVILIPNGSSGSKGHTWTSLYINGNDDDASLAALDGEFTNKGPGVHTSCSQIIVGVTYGLVRADKSSEGLFKVESFNDNEGGYCDLAVKNTGSRAPTPAPNSNSPAEANDEKLETVEAAPAFNCSADDASNDWENFVLNCGPLVNNSTNSSDAQAGDRDSDFNPGLPSGSSNSSSYRKCAEMSSNDWANFVANDCDEGTRKRNLGETTVAAAAAKGTAMTNDGGLGDNKKQADENEEGRVAFDGTVLRRRNLHLRRGGTGEEGS